MKCRILIDHERCKGCELCVAFYPRKVLVMAEKMNARGDHYAEAQNEGNCIGCQQCAVICPDAAIEIDQTDAGEKTTRAGSSRSPAGGADQPAASPQAGQAGSAPGPARKVSSREPVLAQGAVSLEDR